MFQNKIVRFIIDMQCIVQIMSWAIELVGKHYESISMIKSYWTRSQSKTTALTGWFQSGDQNVSGS